MSGVKASTVDGSQISTRAVYQIFDSLNQNPAIRATYTSRVEKIFEEFETQFGIVDSPHKLAFDKIYIPVLRSLRSLNRSWVSEDVFAKQTREQYFGGGFASSKERHQGRPSQAIITGQDFYSRIRTHLVGPLEEREMIRDFQEYLSGCFFDGQAVTLLPKGPEGGSNINEHTLFIKIGHEEERPIHELGDGVSSLIIMLYPLFDYREKDLLLFIEEPENHLHPGFQRILIDAFLNLPRRAPGSRQVFVATHSNQFLDLTLEHDDVSVFRVSKALEGPDKRQSAKVTLTPRSNRSLPLLRELGVRNSSVLLTNKTVWVEGVTDRMYIRHFLSLLNQRRASAAESTSTPADAPSASDRPSSNGAVMEDIHYTIAEYAGSNLDHWNFAETSDEGTIWLNRMCGEAMIVMDADATGDDGEDAKSVRARRLLEKLGDRFIKLDVREIENLISKPVLQSVIIAWEKDRIAISALRPFEEIDYANEYLGRFIHDNILPANHQPRKQYQSAEGSGTILYKPEFAEHVIRCTTQWDQLSVAAQRLTEKIDRFIRG